MASTYKLVNLVGTSEKSFADATSNAVSHAAKTLRGLSWFEVVEQRGRIEDGKVAQYQVKLQVAFKLE